MTKGLTRPFAEIVQERVRREPVFGSALLEEAAQCMLNGELAVARNLVRDVIKGSMGYAELSRRTGTPEKSLVRMFGPNGNPTAANLSRIFAHLQRHEGISLQVSSVPTPSKTPTKRTSTSSRRAG
jgi:DNA-binding phage protein